MYRVAGYTAQCLRDGYLSRHTPVARAPPECQLHATPHASTRVTLCTSAGLDSAWLGHASWHQDSTVGWLHIPVRPGDILHMAPLVPGGAECSAKPQLRVYSRTRGRFGGTGSGRTTRCCPGGTLALRTTGVPGHPNQSKSVARVPPRYHAT
jgi:hypothetical protein